MSHELTVIEVKNPLEVFSKPNGLDAIIDKIEAEAKSIDRDISTITGRDNIRSLAFKLAKSKTFLDKMGKDLTEEQRQQIATVNAERKRAWDRMEALQEEIRAPLTIWENKDKERIAAHEAALALVLAARDKPFESMTSAQVKERMDNLPELMNRDWQEYSERAIREVDSTRLQLETMYNLSLKTEKDAAELAKFRAEEDERTRVFHAMYDDADRENIAFEAAYNARRKAEQKAADDARITAENAAKEKQKIIDDAAAAKVASDKALQDAEDKRIADLARAKDKADALKKQKDEADAAQKVIDDAAAVKAAADKKRAENVAHQGKINGEALTAMRKVFDPNLIDSGAEERMKIIVIAIAQGKIPHVSIKY